MNVLITGAANGLGWATAKYFNNNNHTVYICDIVKPSEENNIKSFITDITNIKDLNLVKDYFINNNITLDIIIHFAGIYDIGSFIEKKVEDIHNIFNVNLLGPINVNNILYDCLSKKGKIIIITSELAPLDPLPFNGMYSVSKTALDSYAQSLRQELNLIGQKVITIRPGAFNTNLANNSLIATQKLVKETVLYKNHSKKFYRIVTKFMGVPKDAKILAKYVYKIANKKNPKYIYKKNRNVGLLLLSCLPKKLQCFIIKQILK